MQGVIVNFRHGKHTQTNNQMVVLVHGHENADKSKPLIGKSVHWFSTGKKKTEIKGKVTALHGRNGAVRVLFEKGMPGQSIGTDADLE